jgi:hypothetical protein
MNNDDLLDLYAGLAMQGLLAANHAVSPESIARVSFEVAEAMMRERIVRGDMHE